MGLVANSSELPLTDLIQLKGHSRGPCTISVRGAHGPGLICMQDGEVVYAEYGGLGGEEAAHALVAEDALTFRATSGQGLPTPNMRVDHRQLLMESAVRSDERLRDAPRAPEPAAIADEEPLGDLSFEPAAAAEDPGTRALPRRPPALRVLAGFVALAALLVLAVTGSISFHRSEAGALAASAPPAPRASVEPIEASVLTGPRDSLPVVLAGEPPRSPAPDLALRPTVVLRILVDDTGRVTSADVFQPRSDLRAFEDAALGAVRQYSFRPAKRDGVPVPAWVNWPVDFL